MTLASDPPTTVGPNAVPLIMFAAAPFKVFTWAVADTLTPATLIQK